MSHINADLLINNIELQQAAYTGDFEKIQTILLKQETDINFQSCTGETSLYLAAQEGHYEVVKTLIESKANLNLTKKNGISPLFIAVQENKVPVADLLIEKMADVNLSREEDGMTPLLMAMHKNRNKQLIQNILAHGANINQTTIAGLSPVYLTVQKASITLLGFLTGYPECDVNIETVSNVIPLYYSALKGYAQMVRMLLGANANVNFAREDGSTALYVASRQGSSNTVKALLEYKASINIRFKGDGPSLPYDVAVSRSTTTVMKYIEAVMREENKNEVVKWLSNFNMKEYKPEFFNNDIRTLEQVKTLTEDDIQHKLKITKLGHRKKIFKNITALNK
eukprot:TRINITY_DN2298_c1_g4_i1.p1 TRINITY_DN2298_c1_g4~~TRINITY_DN2298_c1_g4_i1.p1  ORF type:complete len:339 (+),score=100.58 TRINITY_DN2298_c1_g4_i1:63-1079(+)